MAEEMDWECFEKCMVDCLGDDESIQRMRFCTDYCIDTCHGIDPRNPDYVPLR